MNRDELISNLRRHAAAIRHKVAMGDVSMADFILVLANQEYIMDALAELLCQPRRVVRPEPARISEPP